MNLICPQCHYNYDQNDNLPRLFPSCGHTFCSKCIQTLISAESNIVFCPEDQIQCEFYQRERGINSFPLNFAIIKLIKDKKDPPAPPQQFLLAKKPSIKQKINFCLDHKKVTELICLTDQKTICSECVLFGLHKAHEYIKPEVFKQQVKNELTDLQKKMDSFRDVQSVPEQKSGERQILMQKIELKQNLLIKELERQMNSLKEAVMQKEMEVKEELRIHFQKFENSLHFLTQNQDNLVSNEQRVQSEFEGLLEELNSGSPDFDLLLQKIYGSDNFGKEIDRIVGEKQSHEQNIRKLIYNELNAIQIQGNFAQLQQDIRTNIKFKIEEENQSQVMATPDKSSFPTKLNLAKRMSGINDF